MSNNTPKIFLSFSKTIGKKKLQTSALGNGIPELMDENKQSILLFDKNTKPSEPYKPEDSLVIPLVESKRDTLYKKIKEKQISSTTEDEKAKEETEMTIDDQAVAAVIEESARKMEEIQNKSSNDSFRQNILKIPTMSELLDTEGDASTLDDYDKVNVQHFGAALLRGMGWSKDQGVGKNKQVIDIIDPTNKGLPLMKKEGMAKKVEDTEEEIELKKGSNVLIEGGRNRGTYGVVESVDEDHILIRTAREDKVLRDVEQNVRVVTVKEYKDFSRVINKDMYDEYKAAESKKRKDKQKDPFDKPASKDKKIKKEESDVKKEEISNKKKEKMASGNKSPLQGNKNDETSDRYEKIGDESEKQKEIKRNYDEQNRIRSSKKDKEKDRYYKEDKDVYYKEDKEKDRSYKDKDKSYKEDKEKDKSYNKDKDRYYKEGREDRFYKGSEKASKGSISDKDKRKDKSEKNHSLPLPIPWARENLRVRIIDKEYKGGKYHKEKVVVNSIDTVESCTCISEEGKTLYNINPNNLETVIPKSSSAAVMMVKGNYKGQKARILELHKEQERATIQLLEDRSVILKLYYDDICEYVSR